MTSLGTTLTTHSEPKIHTFPDVFRPKHQNTTIYMFEKSKQNHKPKQWSYILFSAQECRFIKYFFESKVLHLRNTLKNNKRNVHTRIIGLKSDILIQCNAFILQTFKQKNVHYAWNNAHLTNIYRKKTRGNNGRCEKTYYVCIFTSKRLHINIIHT